MLRTARTAALLALLVSGGGPLAAQSLTSVRGLGYPILAADARTDLLGGTGLGLQGLTASLSNPVAAASVSRPGAVVSVAALEQTATVPGVQEEQGATRFPVIQVFFPVRGVVVNAGYGAYLDQAWAAVREGSEVTGGETLTYRDFIRSTGGIGQFQAGVAAPLGDRFAVGATVGGLSGTRRLQFQRQFDSTALGNLQSFSESHTVQYSGTLAQVGARWDPIPALRVAASLTWGGTLTADSVEGPVVSREYDLPIQVAAGASGYLAPSLLASLSGRWSGWSSIDGAGSAGPAGGTVTPGRDTWEVGGGMEWDNPQRRSNRSFPLRIGAQYRQLPFAFASEAPTEWAVGAGAGMRMGASIDNPIARLDFSVQRAERTAPGDDRIAELTETAWRFSVSLSIFGN